MNSPNLAPGNEPEALSGDLRAWERSPRPIPRPEKRSITQIGGRQ